MESRTAEEEHHCSYGAFRCTLDAGVFSVPDLSDRQEDWRKVKRAHAASAVMKRNVERSGRYKTGPYCIR